MAKEIINEDFEIPEHLKAEAEEQGFEIEVVDDTPAQDQNRRPLKTEEAQAAEGDDRLQRDLHALLARIEGERHRRRADLDGFGIGAEELTVKHGRI